MISTMDIPTIHVHTQSDKHTQPYTIFMWETMRSLANHHDKLRMSVHCMGPTAMENLAKLPATKTYHVPNISPDQGLVGSVGHGACVEHALSMTDDGDIHIIVDSDTVVLAKGWDDYVRHLVLDKDVGTFGATYEDVGGFTSGAGAVQTYKGAPNVVWMALSPLHRWQDLRALPEKSSNLEITSAGMSQIYGLPIGSHVLRDVAWQIPEYLASREISYVGLKQLKPSHVASVVLKNLSDYHEEYHVEGDVPFIVHHRGSMKYKYRSDDISVNFYAKVDAWLTEELKRSPRWVWSPNEQFAKTVEILKFRAETSRARINALESTAGKIVTAVVSERKKPEYSVAPAARLTETATVNGWAKIAYGNKVILSRHVQPTPAMVNVDFVPGDINQTVRVEGNVLSGLQLKLPATIDNTPYKLVVRNATPGTINVSSMTEGRACSCDMPASACWLLLVDVDGVIHVN